MKRLGRVLGGLVILVLFVGCGNKSEKKEISTTTGTSKKIETSSSKENKTVVNGKNFSGTMGKFMMNFSFIDNEHYLEKSTYSVATGDSVRVTEGTYKIKGDEILLKNDKDMNCLKYASSGEKEAYAVSDETSRELFEKLFIEEGNQLLITYGLDKNGVKTAADDSYGTLKETDSVVNKIDQEKKALVMVKDTSNFFRTEEEYGQWVLKHMARPGYSLRNLASNSKLETGEPLRYSVNVYVEGGEQAPGTTIAIDYKGNMYEDTPQNGKPRMLSLSSSWDELLDKDISAGEVVVSEDRVAFDRLIAMQGIWAIVPGDSGFQILKTGDFEINSGPGTSPNIKITESVSFDGNKMTVIHDNKPTTYELVDEETLKLEDGPTFKKIPPRN